MESREQTLKIAVIGAGISGITAAYLLQRKHRVTLFEKNEYFGGHTNTINIPAGPDAGTPVDTGFIVLNYRTYPNFIQFLKQLSVATERTEMSFSYYDPGTGLYYATRNLNTFFAQRVNLLKPWYWRFLFEIKRFLLRTREDYYEDRLEGLTLVEYLHKLNYSDHLIHKFVVPWSAAIWSAADLKMLEFPMKTFAQFYENHGLLSVDERVPWYFVKGGSQTYVRAFLKSFKGKTFKEKHVKGVTRNPEPTVTFQNGSQETFDKIVIAVHADEAFRLLEDPSEDEKRLLSSWKYSQNRVFLHTDMNWMPANRRSWASWNYIKMPENKKDSPITLTYYMNRLQNLKTKKEYLVTLNPSRTIKNEAIIKQIDYTHPLYCFSAFESQKELANLNGANNTFFCGSYFGYGFHEDGVKSAIEVGKHFNIEL
jgi:predicted NAD/FAD-binding protein